MKSTKPGPRHQRSLNPDFSLCGIRRSTGAVFSPSSGRVTCPECKARQAAARKAAAARLADTPPLTEERSHR